jgi:Type II secretion system (T2SS), protein E, N-terminal domain
MNPRDLPLGRLLVAEHLLTPADVAEALVEAQDSGRRLGEVLIEWKLLSERDLARFLAQQEGLDFVDLAKHDLDDAAVDCLPESLARAHGVVAYGFHGTHLLVAVADPTNDAGLDAVREAVGRRLRFFVAPASEVKAAQAEAYGEPFSAPPAEQLA